jgi:hypothetical protein
MEIILTWMLGIACFIQLVMVIVACIKSRIINKQNQEMESEV